MLLCGIVEENRAATTIPVALCILLLTGIVAESNPHLYVPVSAVCSWVDWHKRLNPKSAILARSWASSNMLSGFRSRCSTPTWHASATVRLLIGWNSQLPG